MRLTLFVFAFLLCGPALAHVTANPNEGEEGKYFETKFRISHGCEGSDTIAVSIKIPEGIVVLKPQSKPGWTMDITKRRLDTPVSAGHGKMVDKEFAQIIWKGGPLSDSQYDEFGILFKLPDAPNQTLWFPVTQTCVSGENRWIEIPKDGEQWHDLKAPAPFVKIKPAAAGHSH